MFALRRAAVAGMMMLGIAACGSSSSPSTSSNSSGGGATPTAAAGTGNAVNIQNFAFNPPTLTVPTGTKVTWTNNDSAPHTATSDSSAPAAFDSGNLNQGGTFTFTFSTAGTYTYHCTIHGFTATITVTG